MAMRWNIAVVGTAGGEAEQLLDTLAERGFPVGWIKFLSEHDAGQIKDFRGKPLLVEKPVPVAFQGVDIVFLVDTSTISPETAAAVAASGATRIDLSAAAAMGPDSTPVVPEVNPDAVNRQGGNGTFCVPSGASIQLAIALKPLLERVGIRRIVVSTYHSLSTSGNEAIEELRSQTIDLMSGRPVKHKAFAVRIAFNCLPQIGPLGKDGYSLDERAIADETSKILGGGFGVTATAVHVPLFYGLCQTVNIETEQKLTPAAARKLISAASGCKVVDNPAKGLYPMPSEAAGQDLVLVGRVRADDSIANGLNLWLAGDDLRNRANCAVGIAELVVEERMKRRNNKS